MTSCGTAVEASQHGGSAQPPGGSPTPAGPSPGAKTVYRDSTRLQFGAFFSMASDSVNSAARRSWKQTLFRLVPAIDSLRTYTLKTFGADAMAGLTVAAVAVPQAMAYAQIIGLPPQYGLYTAIVMTAIGAILDSSKQLINGPTNAISIAVLSALVVSGGDKLTGNELVAAAILLAFMVGMVQLGIALLRLGDLTRFISHAVIVGFTLGASMLLVMDQLKNLLGLAAKGGGHDHFLVRFWMAIREIHNTHLTTLLLGLGTIAIALALRLVNWRFKIRLPSLLLAVIASAAVVGFWQLDKQGVSVVGDMPQGLPSLQLPDFTWSRVQSLAGASVTIALLGLLEAVAMAKAIAAQTRQKLDINQQCLSEAVANVCGSMFQCFPGSGSLTRSNINQQAGALTQWSGVISAAVVALVVWKFAHLAFYIPRSALAGILILSSERLVNWRQLWYYLRTTRFDAWILGLTAVAAVAVSVEFCVLIGVFLSFVLYVPRAARMHLTELVMAQERVVRERVSADVPCDKIRIFNLEGELFFGAATELEQHLETVEQAVQGGVRALVLRVKRVRNPDAVCLEILDRFVARMRDAKVAVVMCGVRPDLMKVLRASGLVERVGPQHVFVFQETGAVWSSTLEAIRFAYGIVGTDFCDHCPRRTVSPGDGKDWYYAI